MDFYSYLLPYAADWLNLLVRWLHLIVGIAWIGASFYFVWLDNTIRPPAPGSELAEKGVAGHLWAVHGGGFYNPQKYLVAPKELPPELHWFKWEAYSTWLSGFALLVVVYYFNAGAMMVDRTVADLTSWQAIAIGIGTLVAGWTVYDLLCRSPLGKRDGLFGVVMFAFIVAVAYVLSTLLSGRAAYIHVGAMIGTIMVGNVLMLIIPGQRKMVEAMRAFGMTYNHRHSWLVLAGILAAGVLIRHFFNLKHKGRIEWRYPAAGVFLLLLVALAIAPQPPAVAGKAAAADQFAQVRRIVEARCVACHAQQPTQPGFAAAPAGMRLDTPELIRQNAVRIHQRAVQNKDMPLANLTHMTDEERAAIGAWFAAGAK
jgi:uncharacterized membrane protein